MRVLVVDDNKVDRQVLRHYLEAMEHEVLTAGDGIEALKLMGQHRFHLVMTDWTMPRMSGLELISKIRQIEGEGGHTFIILLSSRDSQEALMRGIAVGADDYIVKPFGREQLRVRVRAVARIVALQHKVKKLSAEISSSPSSDLPPAIIVAGLDACIEASETLNVSAVKEVIDALAVTLKETLRKTDKIWKQFGEEFYIVAPGLGRDEAMALAERLRAAVERAPIRLPDGNEVQATCSFGVAFAASGAEDELEVGTKLAEEALAQARRTGGNAVEISD